jgi:hypothetical protein
MRTPESADNIVLSEQDLLDQLHPPAAPIGVVQ